MLGPRGAKGTNEARAAEAGSCSDGNTTGDETTPAAAGKTQEEAGRCQIDEAKASSVQGDVTSER